MLWLSLALSSLLGAVSCAKVGDPLPPLIQIPPKATDVRLVQIGQSRVALVFPTPSPEEVSAVELARTCDLIEADSLLAVARIPLNELPQWADPEHRVIEDPSPDTGQPCRYTLNLINLKGNRSTPSEPVSTLVEPVAGPPLQLRVQVMENEIVLNWDPPARSGTQAASEQYLVNSKHVVDGRTFRETDFAFGEEVTFLVQTITRLQNPTILSEPSEEVSITPRDTFPPAPPGNLTAVAVDAKVQLIWDQGSEQDLAGYQVYRSSDGKTFTKLSDPVTLNRYVDEAPQVGAINYYVVTTLDQWGNESAQSDQVSVSVN